jgi:hypothetical protein
MAKMGFAEAKKIRGESLSNRIASRLVGGESFGTSISKSLSEGTKARMTGLREKINPMNIAKFMTGGSPLAAAVVGRMFGASKEDMKYFTGKQGKMDTASKIKPAVQDEGVMELLNEIYLLLEDSRKSSLKEFPTEEEIMERESRAKKRHDDLLKALNYKQPKEQTATKEKEEEGLLKNILSWFKSPLGVALLGLTSMAALFGALYVGLKVLNENTPNMKALSPDEAQAILQSDNERDIEAAGGRQFLEDIVVNGKQRAINALQMPETTEEEKAAKKKAILDMGGESKVKAIAEDIKTYEVPAAKPAGEGMADKLPFTKEEFIGKGSARKVKEDKWNKNYAPYYNDDGTKKTATPQPITSTPQEESPQTALPKADSLIPPQEDTPSTAKVNEVIRENVDLNLPTAVTSANETINNTTVNTESQVPRQVTEIPAVRNLEETFQRMILYSTRVV